MTLMQDFNSGNCKQSFVGGGASATDATVDWLFVLDSEDANPQDGKPIQLPFTWTGVTNAAAITALAKLTINAPALGNVSLTLTGPATPDSDLFQANPNGVTAGERAKITSDGSFSHTRGKTDSECFGLGSECFDIRSVAVGQGARADTSSVSVGKDAGKSTGTGNICIGYNTAPNNSVNYNIIIGHSMSASSTEIPPTGTSNICVIGNSSSGGMTDYYWGSGYAAATPNNIVFHGVGGSGTNIAGADFTLTPGPGTGTGLPGSLLIKAAPGDAGSGSTRNDDSATVIEVTANATVGELGFFGATPVAQPSGTGETTGFTAGSGTGVNDDSTFTGNVGTKAYRISDVVKALKNVGIMAAS